MDELFIKKKKNEEKNVKDNQLDQENQPFKVEYVDHILAQKGLCGDCAIKKANNEIINKFR